MRVIGLLGGTSWESTAVYYALLNRGAAARLGPRRQPPLLLHSADFAEVAKEQHRVGIGRRKLRGSQRSKLVYVLADGLGVCARHHPETGS